MSDNPYEAPAVQSSEETFDRAARAGLADAIRRFLDEKLTAFAFDETVRPFHASTDPTVRFAAEAVWYHYDDCTDHQVCLSREEWNYFQRLLLLLESECRIEVEVERRWSWTQALALIALAGFGACIWRFGWGLQAYVLSIPFGAISILIWALRSRRRPVRAYERILAPFGSFAELSAAYRSTGTFRKARWPRKLADRKIRSEQQAGWMEFKLFASWLLCSPVPLLAQTLPQTETRTRIRLS